MIARLVRWLQRLARSHREPTPDDNIGAGI